MHLRGLTASAGHLRMLIQLLLQAGCLLHEGVTLSLGSLLSCLSICHSYGLMVQLSLSILSLLLCILELLCMLLQIWGYLTS